MTEITGTLSPGDEVAEESTTLALKSIPLFSQSLGSSVPSQGTRFGGLSGVRVGDGGGPSNRDLRSEDRINYKTTKSNGKHKCCETRTKKQH